MSPEQTPRVSPVSPEGLAGLQKELIPEEVIETFNRHLGEQALHGYARIYQDDIVQDLAGQGLDRGQMFKKGWLNVEAIYEEAGWEVKYDQPGYNESGRAHYSFRAKNRRT